MTVVTRAVGTGARTAGVALGLRPRPDVDPVVAALVAEAALELWPGPPAVDPVTEAARAARTEQAERTWRFSGRWWTSRPPLGRDRPWVR